MEEINREGELAEIFEQSGLWLVLSKKATQQISNRKFAKLLFDSNIHHLSSIEIHETQKGPYFRIHYKERVDPLLKYELKKLSGAILRPSCDRGGINLEGDFLMLAKGIAEILGNQALIGPSAASPVRQVPDTPLQVKSTKPGEDNAQELRAINISIWEFANRPENRALVAKTRSYSTPFRGPLFGQLTQDGVATVLTQRRVDVLLLGANPNDTADNGKNRAKHRSLHDQMQTDFFSEAHWNSLGKPTAGWSPFTDSKPGWKFLLRTIQRANYSSDAVSMANYIPWGSKDFQQFAMETEQGLLERIINFADQMLIRMIQLLRPRLVIAPFSITAKKNLQGSTLAQHRKRATHRQFSYAGKTGDMSFNTYHGIFMAGDTETMLVHLQHPSSIRVPIEALDGIEHQLAKVFTVQQLSSQQRNRS